MHGSSTSLPCRPSIIAAAWFAVALLAASGPGIAAPLSPDPASRLPAGDDASEYWDVTAVFESGHRFFGRWMITNEGPGSRSAIAIGHLVFPDGRTVPFKNGRLSGRWELSDDGRRIRVASSILDWSGSQGLVEIDKNKDGIRIELHFERGAVGARKASVRDSKVGFDVLAANAPVHGSVWVKGMDAPIDVSGRLAATHAWMDASESERTLRRIEFFAADASLAIYLSDELAPDGARQRKISVERDGVVLVRSDRFDLEIEPAPDSNPDYPVPVALRVVSPDVEGTIRLGRLLVAHDPMEALPQPFRFLLSFKSRPHRVWVDSAYEFRIEHPPVDAAAGGVDRTEIDREGPKSRQDPTHRESDTGHGDRHDPDRSLALRGSGIANLSFTNPLRTR
jgi:hypothetical protein